MQPFLSQCEPRRVCRFWENNPHCRGAAAALTPGEIQLWFAPVPARDADLADWLPLLDPVERLRSERIVHGEPRRRFLAGRVFLRQLLVARFQRNGGLVALEPGPGGKPRLAVPREAAACRFSLSHGGGWLVVALAADREVGVDLEPEDTPGDWRTLLPTVCSPRETRALWALPAAERETAFLRAWTRKEAILKASGTGLGGGISPAAVEVLPDCPEVRCPSAGGRVCRWGIAEISPPLPGHIGAVAWETA